MTTMKPWILTAFLLATVVVDGRAGDARQGRTVLAALPARAAAARRAAEPGLSSGVTPEMHTALTNYNAALRAMILELGKAGYAKPFTKADVDSLEKALATCTTFAQNAGNPEGEFLGTVAALNTASAVSDGLEATIVTMAKALFGDENALAFAKWKKNWDKAITQKGSKTREHFGVGEQGLDHAARPVRLAAAWALHHRTNQSQRWIAKQLGLHSAANVSQQVRRLDTPDAPPWFNDPRWLQWRKFVKNC